MLKNPRLILPALFGAIAAVLAVIAVLMMQPASRLPLVGGPFQLIAQDGRTVTDRDFLGHPFLVFFGYTHCPDVCPTTMFEVSEVLRALGPDAPVKVLFITVDPERDTPTVLKDYTSAFDPRVIGLSGDRPAIEAAERAYRVYAKQVPGEAGDYTYDHTALVYLMGKDGGFVRAFSLDRKPEAAAAQLRQYL